MNVLYKNRILPEAQVLLLCFILLECIDSKFVIQIPGFPYSVGKVSFITIGLTYLPSYYVFTKHKIVIAYLLIHLSSISAAFLSDFPLFDNLSPALGMLLLFVPSVGFAFYLVSIRWIRLADIYFTLLFCYWAYYIISNTISGDVILSYGHLEDVVNHHNSALGVCLGSLYLIFRINPQKVGITSITLIIFSLAILILSESRSNLIIFILAYLLSFIFSNISVWKFFRYVAIISVFGSVIGYNFIFSEIFKNEFILRRFDPSNKEYIEETNISRVELYNEFIPTLMNYPMGKGLEESKVSTKYGDKLMHNKYATFIIQGGIISVLFVVSFIVLLFKLFMDIRKIIRSQNFQSISQYLKPVTIVLLAYYITLSTVDFGGLNDYLLFAFTVLITTLAEGVKSANLNQFINQKFP